MRQWSPEVSWSPVILLLLFSTAPHPLLAAFFIHSHKPTVPRACTSIYMIPTKKCRGRPPLSSEAKRMGSLRECPSSCSLHQEDSLAGAEADSLDNPQPGTSKTVDPSCSLTTRPSPCLAKRRMPARKARPAHLSVSLREDSDSDMDFKEGNLPTTPSTTATRELALQQGTIIPLRP